MRPLGVDARETLADERGAEAAACVIAVGAPQAEVVVQAAPRGGSPRSCSNSALSSAARSPSSSPTSDSSGCSSSTVISGSPGGSHTATASAVRSVIRTHGKRGRRLLPRSASAGTGTRGAALRVGEHPPAPQRILEEGAREASRRRHRGRRRPRRVRAADAHLLPRALTLRGPAAAAGQRGPGRAHRRYGFACRATPRARGPGQVGAKRAFSPTEWVRFPPGPSPADSRAWESRILGIVG